MLKGQKQERYEQLFEKFVPSSGESETLGGEMLRAASRIGYRFYNDGDRAWEGYGKETVNPAVRFLHFVSVAESENVSDEFKSLISKFYDLKPYSYSDEQYETLVDNLVEAVMNCFDFEYNVGHIPNTLGDMFDFADSDEDKDDEEDDWDEADWEDEFDTDPETALMEALDEE